MRNRESWKPSKYVFKQGRLVASRDWREVSVGSRLAADLVAAFYNENLALHAKGRLLDLGCGKVPLFAAYRDHVSNNICVDWENSLHKNDYLDSECDLTKTLPFAGEQFDTVILSDVLEHIPEPMLLWAEINRVLSKHGKVIMNVPFYYWLHERPHDYYRYTEFALRRFVENSDMQLIHLSSMGGVPEIVTDLFAKNVVRLPRIGNAAAMFAQWLTSHFIRTGLGRKVSNATRDTFPYGYFLIAEKTY